MKLKVLVFLEYLEELTASRKVRVFEGTWRN